MPKKKEKIEDVCINQWITSIKIPDNRQHAKMVMQLDTKKTPEPTKTQIREFFRKLTKLRNGNGLIKLTLIPKSCFKQYDKENQAVLKIRNKGKK